MENGQINQITESTERNKGQENSFHEYNEKLSRISTNLIAAKVIANSNFPLEKTLPRFFPTPFNNFGHYFLFDYKRLLWIIWDTISEIKLKINFWDKWLPYILLFASLIPICIGMFILGMQSEFIGILILLGLVLPLLSFFITTNILENKFRKKTAKLRAQIIRDLLNDVWEPNKKSIPHSLEQNLKLLGNGCIGESEVPIILFFDENHPFPGFGQLQFDQQFVCMPNDLKSEGNNSEHLLREKIAKDLQANLKSSSISNFKIGQLISIPANSLEMSSIWLNSDKTPLLKKSLKDISFSDKTEKSRIFIAIQVILPRHFTGITFFIRIYKAENSAACHISVTTLGPPEHGKKYIEKKLAKHKSENDNTVFKQANTKYFNDKRIKELQYQEILSKDELIFSKNHKFDNISDLDLLATKSKVKSEFYNKKFQLIRENIEWPGRFYYPLNYREENSLTLPADYFGHNEATCIVATLYDQISRSILDSFEAEEYDVSNYKDKEGNYSINADKIDQLIVGENIKVKNKKKEGHEQKKNETNSKNKVNYAVL